MTELMSNTSELMVSVFEVTYELDSTREINYSTISPYEILAHDFPDVPEGMIREVASKLDARGRWIKKLKKDDHDQALWIFAHGAYL